VFFFAHAGGVCRVVCRTFIGALCVLRARKRLTWKMAFALAAIFPASYWPVEFWYDNARVDSLFVLCSSSAPRSCWKARACGPQRWLACAARCHADQAAGAVLMGLRACTPFW